MQDMIYMLKKEGVDFSLTTVISEVRYNTQKKASTTRNNNG